MKQFLRTGLGLSLGLALLTLPTYAVSDGRTNDERGWLVGAGMGIADLSIGSINRPSRQSVSETVQVYTLFGGYSFVDWLGIEFDVSASNKFTDTETMRQASFVGTSFAPKLTHDFNESMSVYFKLGIQYIAYRQHADLISETRDTWLGLDKFFGVGLQQNFDSGWRFRIDYKRLNFDLSRSDNTFISLDLYDDDIDFSLNAITLSSYYQF